MGTAHSDASRTNARGPCAQGGPTEGGSDRAGVRACTASAHTHTTLGAGPAGTATCYHRRRGHQAGPQKASRRRSAVIRDAAARNPFAAITSVSGLSTAACHRASCNTRTFLHAGGSKKRKCSSYSPRNRGGRHSWRTNESGGGCCVASGSARHANQKATVSCTTNGCRA